MKMKLLYGTGNTAKLGAMQRWLTGLDLEIAGLEAMSGNIPVVMETGNTPLENARQKALAYYDAFGLPVFSCDSGLYFEGVPDDIQPGVHVRTVNGKYLTDNEMLLYYGNLAKKYGPLKARYQNAICLVLDAEHIFESMDSRLSGEPFLITAVPHSRVLHSGFPLDSLSIDLKTGKHFYDLEERNRDEVAVGDGFAEFFRSALCLPRENQCKSAYSHP